MTRMTAARFTTRLAIFSFALVFAVGCGPDAKQQKIDELTAENEALKQDVDGRDRQLNDALVRENDAKSTIDELNQQLAKMRADGSKMKNADGWITMPSFDMISVPGAVLFDSGKAQLTSQGRAKLSEIANDIRARYADRDIYVFGHTDDQPIRKSKWKDNWELGANRSLEVVRTLQNNGIPNDYLVQASCGQFRPKSGGSSEAARRQNRRVEFYAVKRNSGVIENSTARGTSEE